MKKKLWYFLVTSIVILLILFFLRGPLLRAAGSFLVSAEPCPNCTTAFVLSGQAYDRGAKAAEMLLQNNIKSVICTGANQSPDLKTFGSFYLESDVTKKRIDDLTDSLYNVTTIHQGTSTQEEADLILQYCKTHNIDSVLIISSMFHTKRIDGVLKKKFDNSAIHYFIEGAPSSVYQEDKWWQNENGLIAVNNEYIKLIYYFIKY